MFYEIYRHKHEGELPVYCVKHGDLCYKVVFQCVCLCILSLLTWLSKRYIINSHVVNF